MASSYKKLCVNASEFLKVQEKDSGKTMLCLG